MKVRWMMTSLMGAILLAGLSGRPARSASVPSSVHVCAVMHPKAGREAALREALLALVGPTTQEAGNIAYEVFGQPDGTLILHEAWRSQDVLNAHLARPNLVAFVARLPSLIEGTNDAHFGRLISSHSQVTSSGHAPAVNICSFKHAKTGQENALRSALVALSTPTAHEPGMVTYNIYQEEGGGLFLFEQWRSQSDLDAHFRTPYVRAFRKKADQLVDQNVIFSARPLEASPPETVARP